MTFAEKIKYYRAKHNLSQTKFALRCNVNPMTISAIENGAKTSSELTKGKIEIVLNEGKK